MPKILPQDETVEIFDKIVQCAIATKNFNEVRHFIVLKGKTDQSRNMFVLLLQLTDNSPGIKKQQFYVKGSCHAQILSFGINVIKVETVCTADNLLRFAESAFEPYDMESEQLIDAMIEAFKAKNFIIPLPTNFTHIKLFGLDAMELDFISRLKAGNM